jgi:hyperosmotically inducible protein
MLQGMKGDSRSAGRLPKALAAALLVVSQATTGCTLLLVGGAAGGGYYVGKEERSLGRMVDDASITSSVKTQFIRDPEVDALDINVDTRNGIVTLHGHVPDDRVAERAAALAGTVKGVTRVESNLAVVPEP